MHPLLYIQVADFNWIDLVDFASILLYIQVADFNWVDLVGFASISAICFNIFNFVFNIDFDSTFTLLSYVSYEIKFLWILYEIYNFLVV